MRAKAGMSDDVAAFGICGRTRAASPARPLPRSGREATFRRATGPKIGSEGLEMQAHSPYLQRQRAPRALRPSAPETPGREDMPAPAHPGAPDRRISDRTRRGAGRVPAARPDGIGDTGDANGDEA